LVSDAIHHVRENDDASNFGAIAGASAGACGGRGWGCGSRRRSCLLGLRGRLGRSGRGGGGIGLTGFSNFHKNSLLRDRLRPMGRMCIDKIAACKLGPADANIQSSAGRAKIQYAGFHVYLLVTRHFAARLALIIRFPNERRNFQSRPRISDILHFLLVDLLFRVKRRTDKIVSMFFVK
jgi:hypothetical protein